MQFCAFAFYSVTHEITRQFCWDLLMKGHLTVKKKTASFTQATLRITPRETDSQKLWELLCLLEVQGTVVCIWETKDHPSKRRIDVLHKVPQRYTVQVKANKASSEPLWLLTALGKNANLRSCIPGIRRKRRNWSWWLGRHSHLWGGLVNVWCRHTLQLNGEGGGPNGHTQRILCLNFPVLRSNIRFISSGGLLLEGVVFHLDSNHAIGKHRQLFLPFHSVCLSFLAFLQPPPLPMALRRKHSVFDHHVWWVCLVDALNQTEVIPLYFLTCWEFASGTDDWSCKLPFLQQLLCSHYCNDFPVDMVGYSDHLWPVKPVLLLEINSSWSWHIISYIHSWVLSANVLMQYLHISSWEL